MRMKLFGAAALVFGALLTSCGGYGYRSGFVAYGPPAPRYGVVGVAPGPGYVWVDGYWGWSGGRYAWMPGRWAVPPRRGAIWVRPEWRHEGHGWHLHEGHWR